jgi:hypothetical protein
MPKPKADMSRRDYLRHLERLNLTIVGAAPIIGISRRHSQRYAAGDTTVPKVVAKLLRASASYKISADKLAQY